MKTWLLALGLAGVALQPAPLSAASPADSGASNTLVRFEIQRGTNAPGRLDVELFDQDKPETVRNFLLYVWSGAFSNSFLHRCVPGFVVQGGGFSVTNPLAPGRFSNFVAVADYGRLTNEFLVGPRLSNTFGTLAMAKVGGDPNSATSQWFFNLGNNTTNLDNQNGGFTVFGRVLESTNAGEGSNILAHFNTLSTGTGIVNVANLGPAYSVFSDLPVSYTNSTRPPTNSELRYVRISVLNRTNQPGPAPPNIALLSPPPNSRFTNQVVTLRGTATDDTAVARVVYRLPGGPLEIGAGTTNWEVNVAPQPGFNTVTVESIDCDGQRSTNSASLTFFYVSQVRLDLQVMGNGKVLDATNGQLLQAGRVYTVNARPGPGQVLEGWSGSVTSASAVLTFQVPLHATNFSLTAKFIPDPFTQLAGTYYGLMRSASSPASPDDSGFLTLALTKRGAFSGRILHRGGRYSYTGRFDRGGNAIIQGTLGGVNRSFSLRLNLTNAAGVIFNAFGSPEVQLERLASTLPATNPPPLGRYTLALPAGSTGAPNPFAPGGNGFGVAKLTRGGILQISGTLGDGTAFNVSSRLSRSRRWPLYVSLDRGRGVFLGWLTASTSDARNIDGSLQWIRPSNAKAVRYPAGFTNEVTCLASAYAPPASGVRVLNWVHGLSRVSGANLELAVTNLVKLSTDNALAPIDANTDALQLGLDLKTGKISGRFAHPWMGTINPLNGVILKREETIRGQFIDRDQTGSLNVSVTPFLLTQSVASVTLDGLTEALKEGGILRFETNGVITVTDPLVPAYDTALDANGHSVIIDGAGAFRLFEVRTNINFSANGVTFANGRFDGTNGANSEPLELAQPGEDACGAAILNLGGTVALTNCVLTNFVAQGGNGGEVQSIGEVGRGGRAMGAAICNLGGRLVFQGCQFMGNRALGGSGGSASTGQTILLLPGAALGGAVFSDGDVEARETLFAENEASGGPAAPCCSNADSFTPPGHAAGGALMIVRGRLVLSSSECRSNTAAGGTGFGPDASVNSGGHGGGLFIDANAEAVVQRTTFTDNMASAGGLILSSNTVPGESRGGAIFSAGRLTLRESTLERNTARGGGILPAPGRGGGVASSGALVIDASSFSENLASGGSSGMSSNNLAPAAEGAGGAVYALSASVLATNSTFASNRVIGSSQCSFLCPTNGIPSGDGRGGALTLVSNSAVLVNLTLAFNRAEPGALGDTNTGGAFGGGLANFGSTLTLRNSIVASNTPLNIFGAITDAGFNFSSDDSFIFTATGSRTNTDPLLGPLTTNGGPTRTMALLSGSPARDIIPANNIPRFDQRGIDRPQGSGGDAGAVEMVIPAIPPLFTVQPTGAVVRAGNNLTFQAIATGTAPIAFFWLKDGTLLAGATNSTLLLTNVQATNAGDYVALATNVAGSVTSLVAVLVVDSSPLIVVQPANLVLGPGANDIFSVVAAGPALHYSWLRDNAVLAGATNATLSITNAAPADRGSYQVIITNLFGAVTSRVVTLSFSSAALRILSQPSSILVQTGAVATFNVLVSGVPPFGYQWLFGSAPLDGRTINSLIITNVSQTNAGTYQVVVTNAYASVTSVLASLIIDVTTPPVFILQPTGGVVRIGSNFTFRVLATGTAPISYSWLKDGAVIPGATSTNLSLTNLSPTNSGNYASVAVNTVGSATSSVVTLTVDAGPLITTQPSDVIVAPGANAGFGVVANGPNLAYAWLRNNQPLTNATNATLSVSGAGPIDRGTYHVVITNLYGAATSRLASLTFDATALNIFGQPADVLIPTGQIATFTVIVGGVPPFKYQWWLESSPLLDETNGTLAIPNVTDANAGAYRVVITNDYLSVTSSPATLTIETPPVFTLQPTGGVARLGSNFTFQVLAAGSAPIAYFWLKNGLLLPDATGSTLLLANVQDTNVGAYAAIATNRLGAVTSLVATLNLDLTPLIVSEPGDVRVAPGANTNFTVVATGPDLTYAWRHNDQALPDATNAVLAVTNAAPSDRGPYQVIITNLFGAVTSRLATLVFDTNALVIVTQPTNAFVQTGQTATFTVVVAGVAPFAYQWLFGGTVLPNETNSTLAIPNVTDTNAGSYQATVTNAYLAVTSALATLTINTNAAPAPLLVSPTLSLSLRGETLVIMCEGAPGKSYRLLSSETLAVDEAVWRVAATDEMPPAGILTWTLPIQPGRSVFYRAASP